MRNFQTVPTKIFPIFCRIVTYIVGTQAFAIVFFFPMSVTILRSSTGSLKVQRCRNWPSFVGDLWSSFLLQCHVRHQKILTAKWYTHVNRSTSRSLRNLWSWLAWVPAWHHGALWRRTLLRFSDDLAWCRASTEGLVDRGWQVKAKIAIGVYPQSAIKSLRFFCLES